MFLSKRDIIIDQLIDKYPTRISCNWVPHINIRNYLLCGDYGILIRAQSITNTVAAPTKFAEYLISGLRVLISANLGDYSDFVSQFRCGEVVTSQLTSELSNTTYDQKSKLVNLVNKHFIKSCYNNEYLSIINKLNS